MLKLVSDQNTCNEVYKKWLSLLKKHSVKIKNQAWRLKGHNVLFGNYGHDDSAPLDQKVTLGWHPDKKNGIVQIVSPRGEALDRHGLTIVAKNGDGNRLLLRAGRLQKNRLSRLVKPDAFERSSALSPLEIYVEDRLSNRPYYLVANIDATESEVIQTTANFVLGCTLARLSSPPENNLIIHSYHMGADEKGSVTVIDQPGWIKEVYRLQGYVWQELKAKLGEGLQKPQRHGFAVDAIYSPANLLIEIKTSINTSSIYEAVGQLSLYPHIIGLDKKLKPVLLLPDSAPLPVVLTESLREIGIILHTYNIKLNEGPEPIITISEDFINLCATQE